MEKKKVTLRSVSLPWPENMDGFGRYTSKPAASSFTSKFMDLIAALVVMAPWLYMVGQMVCDGASVSVAAFLASGAYAVIIALLVGAYHAVVEVRELFNL